MSTISHQWESFASLHLRYIHQPSMQSKRDLKNVAKSVCLLFSALICTRVLIALLHRPQSQQQGLFL